MNNIAMITKKVKEKGYIQGRNPENEINNSSINFNKFRGNVKVSANQGAID
jgi:hypothetical protein